MSVYTIDDFALFGLRVGGDGKAWTCGGVDRFRGQRLKGSGSDDVRFGLGMVEVDRSGRWIHEGDGGGTELCPGRDDFNVVVEDVGVGFDRGRHVVVVWKCCCRWDLRERMETLRFFRPLLSFSEGVNGFFRW